MKRGLLLRAAAKKIAADKRNQLQTSEPRSSQTLPSQQARSTPLPTSIEDHGRNLTEQEKEGYKSPPSILERNPARIGGILFTTMPHIDDGDGSTEWVINDLNAKEKVFETPGYPARIPKTRPDLYEVRMTSHMGQGVFAKRNINCGELILSERPLLLAPTRPGDEINSDLANQYSLDQLQQVTTSEFEKLLDISVQRMGEKEKAIFLSLHNSTAAFGTLVGITRTNAFGTDISGAMYGGVCNIGSRINHSCMPNVAPKFKLRSFSYQFFASRGIKAGEQLFSTYIHLDRTKVERQSDLAPYGFSCNCPACTNATPATDRLRKTSAGQVARLRAKADQLDQPLEGWKDDILPLALLLETKMVAEGLDCAPEFFTLLNILFVTFMRLGRLAETVKYKIRLEECFPLRGIDKPFQTWLDES